MIKCQFNIPFYPVYLPNSRKRQAFVAQEIDEFHLPVLVGFFDFLVDKLVVKSDFGSVFARAAK